MAAGIVRAAGGVLWRPAAGPGGGVEVCLVHRPRYDDWSLPKGKLDAGEHPLAAAVREVAEETGARAAPQVHLSPVRYQVRDGSPKVVDFWSMRLVHTGDFHPTDEVDGLRWLPVPQATGLVSYPRDAEVLAEFTALPPVTGVVPLVRHGYAGERGGYPGPDTARPLTPAGEAQAAALAGLLALFRPTRLVSAAPRRCVQTLAPLAAALDLPIEVDLAMTESTEDDSGDGAGGVSAVAAARLAALAGPVTARAGAAPAGDRTPAGGPAPATGGPSVTGAAPVTVVCGQRAVIAPAVARLTGGRQPADRYATPKGTGWVLAFTGDRLAALERLSPTG